MHRIYVYLCIHHHHMIVLYAANCYILCLLAFVLCALYLLIYGKKKNCLQNAKLIDLGGIYKNKWG